MISRRSILRGAASASAVAAGGMAVMATPSAAEHPDAELIVLGAEFDRLFALYKPMSVEANEKFDAYMAAKPKPFPAQGTPAHEAFWNTAIDTIDPYTDKADKAGTALDRIVERMQAIPAATLAGFAAKARTLRFTQGKWGDDPRPMDEWDWDDETLEMFIRDAETLGSGGAV